MKEKQETKYRAKKSLGQNFLTSEKVAKIIVDFVDPEEIIIEIGPGKGMLTKFILEKPEKTIKKIVAVEKDDELSKRLEETFSKDIDSGKLEVKNEDILDFEATNINTRYSVVGNIPYNITGKILRHFLELEKKPKSIVLMIQKEVGERILAKGGKESVLSISIKAYGKPYIVKNVPAKHFIPKPKVDSVVIKIDNISADFLGNLDQKEFFTLVKAGFREKRKKLVNNISGIVSKDALLNYLKEVGLPLGIRAEDLTIDNWKQISKLVKD